MEERVKKCFNNVGIIIDATENFDISEYLEDSLSFITFIVEVEDEFKIEIPDEYLMEGKLVTYQDVLNMINQLIDD